MRIPLTLYSISAQALLDTGAAASFISLDLVRKLPLSEKEQENECQTIRPLFKQFLEKLLNQNEFIKSKLH